MHIKQGSRWYGNDGSVFVVDRTETRDGKDWIFYYLETEDPQEEKTTYSCHVEAFTHRFWEHTNEH